MRKTGSSIIYSPSDLLTFLESPFASWMDRQRLEAPDRATPDPDDAESELWASKGRAHEAAMLDRLRAEHGSVWMPAEGADPVDATLAAMRRGESVIHQGALRAAPFEGRPDFLLRLETPSALGEWSYVPADAKLSRQPKPHFLIQLAAYAEMLEAVQGARPSKLEVLTGDSARHSFRTSDVFHYYAALKRQFLSAHEALRLDSRPIPDGKNDHGRWQTHANRVLEELDHLSRVANVTRLQIKRLSQAQVTTMRALAESSAPRIVRMDGEVYERLREQAQLQIMSRGRATPDYRVLPSAPHRARSGLALMPPASPMDVHFDMEGFPLISGGLEYLFGAFYFDRGTKQFKDLWAHDRDGERAAFEQFVDWVWDRYERDPSMHVYHYAPYEVTALKRLALAFASREQQLDVLLRDEKFVDLFQVVRQALRVGEPRYSLKNIERLYRPARGGDVATAAQSIVEYARWQTEHDGDTWATSKILEGIRDYNRDDCESTWQLAEWLRERQRESRIAYVARAARPDIEEPIPARWQAVEDMAKSLGLHAAKESDPDVRRIHELLGQLVTFHRRESKPTFWNYYRRRDRMDLEELREDPNCIAEARRTEEPPEPLKQSLLYDYAFAPEQETSFAAGDKCELVPGGRRGIVHSIDPDLGRFRLKIGERGEAPPHECSVIPWDYVPTDPLHGSILRTSDAWLRTKSLRPALADILLRRPPRIRGKVEGAAIVGGSALIEELTNCLAHADDTCLPVQGPPGAGKTYSVARVIVGLLRRGSRVAVTSNSHRAIDKLLVETHAALRAGSVEVSAAKVGDDGSDDDDELPIPRMKSRQELLASEVPPRLVGATAWTLSAPELEDAFDFLFVDEAGQVSLANLVAMAPCARTIVLVGDQLQLRQPTQAVHPGESGASSLHYLLEGHAVVPPHRGVFLGSSYRLHPEICGFVSEVFYEGRLRSHPSTGTRWIRPHTASSEAPLLPRAGIAFVPSEHHGNGRSSDEEAAVVVSLVDTLMNHPGFPGGSQC
jgi:uncharacterized protein